MHHYLEEVFKYIQKLELTEPSKKKMGDVKTSILIRGLFVIFNESSCSSWTELR